VIRLRAALLAAALLAPALAGAQLVQIDRGLRAGGLWCFPLASDARQWVYVPATGRLATDAAGRPQLSLLLYAQEAGAPAPAAAADATTGPAAPAGGDRGSTITASGGGAVLHLLVTYDTPPEQVAAAQRELRKTLDRDDLVLRGPIVFKDGRYAVVSAILDRSDAPRKLLATGRAPVMEGNRLALAFDLSPDQASVLMQSFQLATPDVSLVFDLAFDGLTDAYQAELTVDWTEVKKSAAFSAGGSVYFIGADVQRSIDELVKHHAVTLKTAGDSPATQALLDAVYARLVDMLFRPVEPEQIPADQRGGLASAISSLIGPQGTLSSRNTTGWGAYVGFQRKDLETEGRSVLRFDHRATAERHALIGFNVGDVYRRFPTLFRRVSASDPAFRQREVHVAVDGALVPDFDSIVNSVTLTLRKQHAAGADTVKEVVVDRAAAARADPLRLVYGWSGDDDPARWLEYEYRTRWAFKGGGALQSDWTRADAPMVSLYAPYERRTVHAAGDGARLKALGVRLVVVTLEFPFFGERRRRQLVLRPTDGPLDATVDVTLPQGQPDCDFTVVWSLAGGKSLTTRGRDASGWIFVDDLPAQSPAVDPVP
jgi:hypothetical protein